MNGADTSMMASPGSFSMTNLNDCSDATIGDNTASPYYYHNRWWQLAGGLAGGTTYRVHTQSTDPSNVNAQKNMNGQNSFAIWTKATGGTPKVHGLGAMEAYTPLDPSTSAEFYLAQIGAEHAGKTMEIKLWDPGDTNSLSANLQIDDPDSAGYTAASLNYTAAVGTTNTNASSCGSTNVTGASNIPTNTGGSGGQKFGGLLGHDPHPDPGHLHRTHAARRGRTRVVEDPLQHGQRLRERLRPHHLAGPDPRQPGAPRPSVDRRPLRAEAPSHDPLTVRGRGSTRSSGGGGRVARERRPCGGPYIRRARIRTFGEPGANDLAPRRAPDRTVVSGRDPNP